MCLISRLQHIWLLYQCRNLFWTLQEQDTSTNKRRSSSIVIHQRQDIYWRLPGNERWKMQYRKIKLTEPQIIQDISGALELVCTSRLLPWTKHMNVAYNHLRSYVRDKLISVFLIDTFNQISDVFSKLLPQKNSCVTGKKNEMVSLNPIGNKCSIGYFP